MELKRFRITETVEVVRTYEIEAITEEAALDVMYSGEVAPIDSTDVHSEVEVKEIDNEEEV